MQARIDSIEPYSFNEGACVWKCAGTALYLVIVNCIGAYSYEIIWSGLFYLYCI